MLINYSSNYDLGEISAFRAGPRLDIHVFMHFPLFKPNTINMFLYSSRDRRTHDCSRTGAFILQTRPLRAGCTYNVYTCVYIYIYIYIYIEREMYIMYFMYKYTYITTMTIIIIIIVYNYTCSYIHPAPRGPAFTIYIITIVMYNVMHNIYIYTYYIYYIYIYVYIHTHFL